MLCGATQDGQVMVEIRGPLEKGMANHFSILALRTPWTVEEAKRYGTERGTPQVGRCPICYWRSVEKTPERMKRWSQSEKKHPVVDVTGDGIKV